MTTTKQSSSRADEVRERRTKAKKTAAGSSTPKKRNVKTHGPPVMVRGGGYTASTDKSKRSTSRRRYDIALAPSGAEIRLPSVPILHLGWRAISLIVVAGLLAILYFFWNSASFTVMAAEVNGAERLTTEEINRVLNVWNQPIFMIDPVKMRSDLEYTYPELVSVSVQVGLPATVIVTIEERQPLLAWQLESQTHWVDAEGIAFPPRGVVDDIVYVLAEGSPPSPVQVQEEESPLEQIPTAKAFMTPGLVSAVMALFPQAPDGTTLVYDPIHGLGWLDERGWQVYFGLDVLDIETKLHVYETVVDHLLSDGIQPALISVEHIHAPYYRLER